MRNKLYFWSAVIIALFSGSSVALGAFSQYGLPGIYNASPFTLSSGQGSAISVDSAGRVIISPSSTIGSSAPGGSDGELQYNNSGVFGGTEDIDFLPGMGLMIGGELALGWNTLRVDGDTTYSQQGFLTTDKLESSVGAVEIDGTDTRTQGLTYTFDPEQFRVEWAFSSTDFPSTDGEWAFEAKNEGLKFEKKTEGTTGPTFTLEYNSDSQAANDIFGINFDGRDAAGDNNLYGSVLSTIISPTAGAEIGRTGIYSSVAGVNTLGGFAQNGQWNVPAGTLAAPGLTWVTGGTGSGLRAAGVADIRYTLVGIDRWGYISSQMRQYAPANAGLPSIVPSTDADTGIWFATGHTGFSINGTELFRTTATGISLGNNSAASAWIHVQKTTEQLRLGYDASNYTSFTVGAEGDLNLLRNGTSFFYNNASSLQFGDVDQATDGIIFQITPGVAGIGDVNNVNAGTHILVDDTNEEITLTNIANGGGLYYSFSDDTWRLGNANGMNISKPTSGTFDPIDIGDVGANQNETVFRIDDTNQRVTLREASSDIVTISTQVASNFTKGLKTRFSTGAMAGSNPTNAELVTAFGPATGMQGYIGILDANANESDIYIVTVGGANDYWYVKFTQAP